MRASEGRVLWTGQVPAHEIGLTNKVLKQVTSAWVGPLSCSHSTELEHGNKRINYYYFFFLPPLPTSWVLECFFKHSLKDKRDKVRVSADSFLNCIETSSKERQRGVIDYAARSSLDAFEPATNNVYCYKENRRCFWWQPLESSYQWQGGACISRQHDINLEGPAAAWLAGFLLTPGRYVGS